MIFHIIDKFLIQMKQRYVAFLLLYSIIFYSQNTDRGVVQSALDKQPTSFATVNNGINQSFTTDIDGNFIKMDYKGLALIFNNRIEI